MVVAHGEGHVCALEMLDGGNDVQHRELSNAVGKVERETMRDTGTPVVTREEETAMPEVLHHFDHVLRHLGLGVGRMIRSRGRLERSTIAAQVRRDDGVPPRERWRRPVPHCVGLGIAVQEEKRWPRSAAAEADRAAAYRNLFKCEALEEHVRSIRRAEMFRSRA